jgi:hypothetical protein
MPTSSSRSHTPRKGAGKRGCETAEPETLRPGDGGNGPLAIVDDGLPLLAVVLPTGNDELGTVNMDRQTAKPETLRPGDGGNGPLAVHPSQSCYGEWQGGTTLRAGGCHQSLATAPMGGQRVYAQRTPPTCRGGPASARR